MAAPLINPMGRCPDEAEAGVERRGEGGFARGELVDNPSKIKGHDPPNQFGMVERSGHQVPKDRPVSRHMSAHHYRDICALQAQAALGVLNRDHRGAPASKYFCISMHWGLRQNPSVTPSRWPFLAWLFVWLLLPLV